LLPRLQPLQSCLNVGDSHYIEESPHAILIPVASRDQHG
jgi:hypothetical protein